MEQKSVKVLQIIRHMNAGGAETLIMNLYRNIDKSKVQFDFLVFGEGIFDKEITELGGKIYYMKYLTDIGPYLYKKNLIKFFKEHNEYKIIHSHIDQVSGIIVEAAKKAGVPIRISHSHSTNNSNNWIVKIYKKILQKKIKKYANYFFACSEKAANWLFEEKSKSAYIINNGINVEKFLFSKDKREIIRKEFGIAPETTVIGHVGSLISVKNHSFLLEVFKEYLKYNENSVLLLVGDGNLKEELKQQAHSLNIEKKIYFAGVRFDVEKFYSAFDVFVFPSLYEGISTALIEAQTNGLPIYTSDKVDVNTDVTNTINFLSVENGVSFWAESIIKNKAKRNDNLQLIRDSGFDIKDIAKKLQQIYQNLYYKETNSEKQ